MPTVVKGPSALATRRWQNMFLFAKITSEFVLAKCQVCCTYQHPRGTPLHKRAGCAPRISKTTAIKLLACKNKCLCPFLSFSMLPSLLQRIHTNMRAVPRLHCTGRKGRPEWVFRSVMKTPINSLRNDSFRINFTLVIMWQPVWTRSCTKLIRISCKRPLKVYIPRASRFARLSEY